MTREGANKVLAGEEGLDAVLRSATRRLEAAGVDAPAREARLLVAHALGVAPGDLLRLPRHAAVAVPALPALLRRRAEAREPLAYLLGTRGFWTLALAVSPATLIPRADTETLIEAALEAAPGRGSVRRILDLGTGTGAILLAALTEFPLALGIGVDRVAAACRLATANAAAAKLDARAMFVCGDWAASLGGRFDLIFSNPPYIESGAIPGLMPEVARHEPASALDGGADGLDCYRAILHGLGERLSPGGLAILELGAGLSGPVGALGAAAGLAVVGVRSDLSGTPRAMVFAPSGTGTA